MGSSIYSTGPGIDLGECQEETFAFEQAVFRRDSDPEAYKRARNAMKLCESKQPSFPPAPDGFTSPLFPKGFNGNPFDEACRAEVQIGVLSLFETDPKAREAMEREARECMERVGSIGIMHEIEAYQRYKEDR